jgi:hypothetical protein
MTLIVYYKVVVTPYKLVEALLRPLLMVQTMIESTRKARGMNSKSTPVERMNSRRELSMSTMMTTY